MMNNKITPTLYDLYYEIVYRKKASRIMYVYTENGKLNIFDLPDSIIEELTQKGLNHLIDTMPILIDHRKTPAKRTLINPILKPNK